MQLNRYSFLPLLLAGLLAFPSASQAQQARPAASISPDATESSSASVGDALLFDQTGDESNGLPSQEFEEANAAFDNMAADDFVVPSIDSWTVSSAFVLGAYSEDGGPVEFVDVSFYEDADGAPGDEVITFEDIEVFDENLDGDFDIFFPEAVTLGPGTYWFAAQADMDFGVAGQWFWTKQGTAESFGAELHWINPGDGFETGCVEWSPASTVCGVGGGADGGLDASFQLFGATMTDAEDGAVARTVTIGQNYPNPVLSGTTRIPFSLENAERVSVTIYDALGRQVIDVTDAAFSAGDQAVDVDTAALPNGVYFYRVATESQTLTQKMVVVQ